jgi:hypothetical protein
LRDARGHSESGNSERGAKAETARSETGKHRRRNKSLGEEEDDNQTDEATEGDESDSDDEVFGKRNREEEFTKLADRFAKRKVAIDSVMDKVCCFAVHCAPLTLFYYYLVGQPFERTQDLPCATHSRTRSRIITH